jgi:predicted nucleic-acid-binding protein
MPSRPSAPTRSWLAERGASHLVLAETTWVLSAVYELDARAIATAVEMLLNHEAMSIADPDVVRGPH